MVDGRKRTADYLESLQQAVEKAAKSPGVEEVHDLRVAVRRATQALRLFAAALGEGTARRLRKRIRKIRREAAAVRDRDVIYENLRRLRLPETDPACMYLRGERAMAAEHLQRMLRRQKPLEVDE